MENKVRFQRNNTETLPRKESYQKRDLQCVIKVKRNGAVWNIGCKRQDAFRLDRTQHATYKILLVKNDVEHGERMPYADERTQGEKSEHERVDLPHSMT